MKYKQFVAGFVTCIILLSAIFISGFAEDALKVVLNRFPIFINGQETAVEAYNINGFTFLKLADVGKAIPGTTVKFNEIDERIEINSAGASLPKAMDESEVESVSTTIEYDLNTMLPVEAEFVEYKGCDKAVSYNGNIYISRSDLSRKFGIKSVYLNVKAHEETFKKDNSTVVIDLEIAENHFLNSVGTPFFNINLFNELIGE
jgi:hypothetical protein